MPQHLKRRLPQQVNTGSKDLHFIKFGCYHRKRLLDSVRCRNMAVRMQKKVESGNWHDQMKLFTIAHLSNWVGDTIAVDQSVQNFAPQEALNSRHFPLARRQ